MGKASRSKRASSMPSVGSSAGRKIPVPWITAGVLVVILGVFIVAISRSPDDDIGPVANQDHWHAAIGFNVCGEWQPDAPEFEAQAGTSLTAGVHSHGDGLIHLHPFSTAEAGNNATVGLWMDYGGWRLDEQGFSLWNGQAVASGDECPDGPGELVWSVNGVIQTGNPADYKPNDLDVIAIGFLSEGQELGEPPSAAIVSAPTDVLPTDPDHDAVTTVPADDAPSEQTSATETTSEPTATETNTETGDDS